MISQPKKHGCLCELQEKEKRLHFLCDGDNWSVPEHLLVATSTRRSCLQGSSEEMVPRLIPLGLRVPTQQGRDQVERCWECTHCRVNQPLPLPPSKNFYLNAKLSGLPGFSSFTQHFLFNPRDTHRVRGRQWGKEEGRGGLQENRRGFTFSFPNGLFTGPLLQRCGEGLTAGSKGSWLVLSSPLLCSSPTPAFRLPPLPALCPDLAGSVPHPSWAA